MARPARCKNASELFPFVIWMMIRQSRLFNWRWRIPIVTTSGQERTWNGCAAVVTVGWEGWGRKEKGMWRAKDYEEQQLCWSSQINYLSLLQCQTRLSCVQKNKMWIGDERWETSPLTWYSPPNSPSAHQKIDPWQVRPHGAGREINTPNLKLREADNMQRYCWSQWANRHFWGCKWQGGTDHVLPGLFSRPWTRSSQHKIRRGSRKASSVSLPWARRNAETSRVRVLLLHV